MSDEYKISVKSYELIDPIITEPAVHNEIAFTCNGKTLLAFNGDAWDRDEGEMRFPSMSGRDTLRVRATLGISLEEGMAKQGLSEKFPLISEATLFNGSQEEFAEHAIKALEAAEFINHQNIDYIIIGAFTPGQNSNSVAHTLTHAMGLEYPPEAENLWAPGHGRILLPNNWHSSIEGRSDEDRVAYIKDALERLNESNVGEQVQWDENPYKDDDRLYRGGGEESLMVDITDNSPRYFDPENPKDGGPINAEKFTVAEASEQAAPTTYSP